MTLGSGTRLGPYEIQTAIGVGGMGEVYKARDTRLDRSVAIKVLPPHVSADPRLVLVVCLVLAFPCLVFGQAQTAQPPKPGPEVQKLAYWVGTWKSEGEVKVGDPSHPVGKSFITYACEWFAGGFHVVCRAEGTGPRGKMTALLIRAYDTEAKAYTEYFISSRGETELDRMTVTGNTWMSTWEGQEAGKPAKFRFTEVQESPTAYTFKVEESVAGGPWTVIEEGKATKVAGDTACHPGGDVSAPVLVKSVMPQWNARIQGVVVVECVVMPDGVVGDVRVVGSLDSALDQEAIKAVKQWQFKPGMRDGKPVPVWVTIELTNTARKQPHLANQQD